MADAAFRIPSTNGLTNLEANRPCTANGVECDRSALADVITMPIAMSSGQAGAGGAVTWHHSCTSAPVPESAGGQ